MNVSLKKLGELGHLILTVGLLLILTSAAVGRQKNIAAVPEKDDESIAEKDSSRPDTNIPRESLHFKLSVAKLDNSSKARLDDVALQSQQNPRSSIVVDGHRDSAERKGLSFTRAKNARDYLVAAKYIDAARIELRNAEDSCPDESGDPALNRRSEVWVLSDRERADDIKKVCRSGKPAEFFPSVGPTPSVKRHQVHRRAPRHRTKRAT